MGKKGRSRRAPKRVDAEDVLGGRVEPRLSELLELIRRRNPTGRDMEEDERARAYALKSRLQSLLILRFANELTFHPMPDSEGVIGIRHRYGGGDACHAVLAELEVEARALVQRRLDTAAAQHSGGAGGLATGTDTGTGTARGSVAPANESGGATGREVDADAATADELVASGMAALESYDYEEAHNLLDRGLEACGGAALAAEPLLALLVDHLADYAGAAALATRLAARALSEPAVRSRLAMAEARLGRTDRAEELVSGLQGNEAAEVLAVLAAQALAGGDDSRAARLLEAATRTRDGAATAALISELDAIAGRLARLRAGRLTGLEQRLLQLAAGGPTDAAADEARRILSEWPESRVARQVLADVDAAASREHAARLLRAAAEEEQKAAYAAAAVLVRNAIAAAGACDAQLAARLARLEAAAAMDAGRRRLAAVQQRLEGGERRAALADYLELEPHWRAELRRASGPPALDWLEELVAASGFRHKEAIEAALALEAAAARLDQGDAAGALALVAPHTRAASALAAGRALVERAGTQQAEQRRTRARAAAVDSERALAEGRPEEALAALEAVGAQDLGPAERKHLAELRRRAGMLAERARLEHQVEQRLAAGELLAARQALDALGKLDGAYDAREREALAARREELESAIRAEWRLTPFDGEQPPELLRDVAIDAVAGTMTGWLSADGRLLLVAAVEGEWLFVRLLDVGTRRTRRCAFLRAPESLESDVDVTMTGDSAWIMGASQLVEIDCAKWTILRHARLSDFFSRGMPGSHALAPSRRFLWVRLEDGLDSEIFVVDLQRWRVHREMPGLYFVSLAAGEPESYVLGARTDASRIYTEAGALTGFKLPAGLRGESAAVTADGSLVVLCAAQEETDEEMPLELRVLRPDGTAGPGVPLEDTFPDGAGCLAASRADGLVLALADVADAWRLWAFRRAGDNLEQVYAVPSSRRSTLVTDALGARAVLVAESEGGVEIVPFGHDPPAALAAHARGRVPALHYFVCDTPGVDRELLAAVTDEHRLLPEERVDGWIADQREGFAHDLPVLTAVVWALGPSGRHAAQALELAQWMATQWPEDIAVRGLLARCHAGRGDWPEVCRLLAPLAAAPLDEHTGHLLGIALLLSGQPERALAAMEATRQRHPEGGCDLEALMPLAHPLPEPLLPEHGSEGQPLARRLQVALVACDRRIAAGDVEGALRAIDQSVVWRAEEVQTTARLAAAYLQLEDCPRARLFHKTRAAARFVRMHSRRSSMWPKLPLPSGRWAEPELEALEARARAWLDEVGR